MTKRFSILLVVLTIVSGLIGGAITGRIFAPKVAIAGEATQSKVLTVEGLRVVDKDGNLLIYLGKLADKAVMQEIPAIIEDAYGVSDSRGLYIFNTNGSPEVFMQILKTGGSVCVSDKDGFAIMDVNETGGNVGVFGKEDNAGAMPHVLVGVRENGGYVTVCGKDGKTGANMSVDEDGGEFTAYDKDGNPKAVVDVNEYGNGAIDLFDKNGKVGARMSATESDGGAILLDDSMRQEARKQSGYWSKQPSETKPSITADSSTIIGKDGTPMKLIPAGDFQMGSNDGPSNEKPIHTVYLDAFYMDVYEVTHAQYKKFMDATGYKAPEECWNDPDYNAPNHPVMGVSWNDAKAYADWAGKRLPTEAEWEKAARGGLVCKKYPLGDTLTHDDANYFGGVKRKWAGESPVGSFAPNGYGLYDMAGNILEWCADWYDADYYAISPKSNPTGPSSGSDRVLRGGSWTDGYDSTDCLRTADRSYAYPPLSFTSAVGFRCVQDVPK